MTVPVEESAINIDHLSCSKLSCLRIVEIQSYPYSTPVKYNCYQDYHKVSYPAFFTYIKHLRHSVSNRRKYISSDENSEHNFVLLPFLYGNVRFRTFGEVSIKNNQTDRGKEKERTLNDDLNFSSCLRVSQVPKDIQIDSHPYQHANDDDRHYTDENISLQSFLSFEFALILWLYVGPLELQYKPGEMETLVKGEHDRTELAECK